MDRHVISSDLSHIVWDFQHYKAPRSADISILAIKNFALAKRLLSLLHCPHEQHARQKGEPPMTQPRKQLVSVSDTPTTMSSPAASGEPTFAGTILSPEKATSIVGSGLRAEFESSRPYSPSTFAPTQWCRITFILLSKYYRMRLTN